MDELAELIVELTRAVDAAGRGGDLRDDRSGVGGRGLTDAVTAALAVPVAPPRSTSPGSGWSSASSWPTAAPSSPRSTARRWRRSSASRRSRVQADLAAAGVPAPAPLAGPLVLGNGWLTVEELRAGDAGDGYDPLFAAAWRALHDLIGAARPHAATAGSAPGPASR